MTIVFSNSLLNLVKKTFLKPSLKYFLLCTQFYKFQGLRFEIWHYFWQISVQEYRNKTILVTNLIFFFNVKLCILTNLRVLISNTVIIFFKFWLKSTQIRKKFWSQTHQSFFVLHKTLHMINYKVLTSNMTKVF